MTLALVLLSTPAAPGMSWKKSDLGQVKFGKVWNEASFRPVDLAGKVVLVKVWASW